MNAEQNHFFFAKSFFNSSCPGAGKTRTLIAKAQFLLERHSPESIVLITLLQQESN